MGTQPSLKTPPETSFAAVILAAGYSSRFGRCKAAALIEGVSALARCIEVFQRGGVQSIVVVTGAREEEVRAAAPRGSCRFAHNDRFDSGMFSSVQAGLRATEREHGGVFIHLVDIPLLHPSTIKKMASSFAGRATNQWIAPAFEGSGRRGHPVLIPRCWGEAIEAWDGAEGLRGFLARRKAVTVPVFDEGILMDMDAPEDLDRLIIWSKRRHVPGRSTIHALLKAAGTPSHVALHQRRVSEVASTTGQLCGRHVSVDLELLTAAAELHDILKVEPDHAQRGADFLAENGFPEAAELVRGHMDLPETPSVEAQLLYLADRYVNGSTLESLQERERRMTQKFAGDEAAQRAALRRIEVARDIERQVENLTGARPLLHYVATQCSKRRL